MNLEYAGIFDERGHRYHRAMLSQPLARHAEFDRLFDIAALAPGHELLDVPAGGGYLAQHLGERHRVTPLEFTPGFSADVAVVDLAADWPVAQFDHVVCLAALHHIPDPRWFLGKLRRHTRSGGTLHVADVAAGSPICGFLDGFVGRYNGTGHAGSYLSPDCEWLPSLGRVLRAQEVPCPWRFADRAALVAFCMELFGLDQCPADALEHALATTVGIEQTAHGVQLNWRLLYVDIRIT